MGDGNFDVTVTLPSPDFYRHPNFQRYIDVCEAWVTAWSAFFTTSIFTVTLSLAKGKNVGAVSFLQIALFLNMFFTLAQYRSFHSALRDVREVFHSSMR